MPQWHFSCHNIHLKVAGLPSEQASTRSPHPPKPPFTRSFPFFFSYFNTKTFHKTHWIRHGLNILGVNEPVFWCGRRIAKHLRETEGWCKKKKGDEMHFKRSATFFCSGHIPLWSEGGTVGVAGIITGIMRWCSGERGILEFNEYAGLASGCLQSVKPERVRGACGEKQTVFFVEEHKNT